MTHLHVLILPSSHLTKEKIQLLIVHSPHAQCLTYLLGSELFEMNIILGSGLG